MLKHIVQLIYNMVKNCLKCGKEFKKAYFRSVKSWNTAKFCSVACGSSYTSNKKGKKISEQGRINISNSQKGLRSGNKNNWWKGGISKDRQDLRYRIRGTFKYRLWRSDVFTRDEFTCQICGDNKGGNLEGHHIKSVSKIIEENNIKTVEEAENCEELWNINNGLTLCKDCHKKTDNYGSKSK